MEQLDSSIDIDFDVACCQGLLLAESDTQTSVPHLLLRVSELVSTASIAAAFGMSCKTAFNLCRNSLEMSRITISKLS